MRKAFTLIEVNLAMMIMATGILAVVGLFAFGFRENKQSREDIAAAAYADAVISPLVMAISATNLKWSAFKEGFSFPNESGWGAYLDTGTGVVKDDPEGKAKTAYGQLVSKMRSAADGTLDIQSFPSSAVPQKPEMSGALVIVHHENSAVVSIGFRAVQKEKPGELMSMPLFYTEVRFQGLANE